MSWSMIRRCTAVVGLLVVTMSSPLSAARQESATAAAAQEEAGSEGPASAALPPAVQALAAQGQGQAGASVLTYVVRLAESESEWLSYNNRKIALLRARVLGRDPAERAATAVRRLDEVIERREGAAITLLPIETAIAVQVNGEPVFAIVPEDLDPLANETVEQAVAAAVEILEVAIAEAVELRTPHLLLVSAGRAAAATAVFLLLIVVLSRLRHRILRPLLEAANEQLATRRGAVHLLGIVVRFDLVARRLSALVLAIVALISTYAWLTYVLRQFPYTRPWGEALGDTLLTTAAWAASGIAEAMPGLFTILVIVLITRVATRLVRGFLDAVQERRIDLPFLDPDAARPTRKILIGVLWIFAIVVAYPYLPGSSTDAFRGISVFLGVALSIGSTGIVNQGMSGLILMYSSALKPGEYVRIGDVEGTVVDLGMLSTRVRTLHQELVTVPNSVVVAQPTTNYSRLARTGVAVRTTLTLGYDVPWRQLHAVLELAAKRTAGIRETPAPEVYQKTLGDFFVEYELVAFTDDPLRRRALLTELHGHILDLCNEHGIEILSPHFENTPGKSTLIPRERWAPPPAKPAD